MEIIIRGTPEECKKAIKELAEKEKEKEFVPIYPYYYGEMWKWYPSWYYNWTGDDLNYKPTTTGMSSTSSTYSISAEDIKDGASSFITKAINDIYATHNDATSGCFAKSVPTK